MRKRKAQTRRDPRKRRNPDNEVQRHFIPQQPVDEDRFYVIEKIIGKRTSHEGQEEYLVRWLNYPPQWDSWEPRAELERNSKDMISEYERDKSQLDDLNSVYCICRRPYRFDQGGMIQCGKCADWFHFKCLDINMEEANNYLRFYCHDCRSAHSDLRNLMKGQASQDDGYVS